MARNDIFVNINATSPADAFVTGQQDMTAADAPELILGDTPTFNFYFTDNTNVWPSWAGNAAYTVTWALSDAISGDFAPAATTGNATPITGGWSIDLPLNAYDLVGLLNTKRVSQAYPVSYLWQQIRVTAPTGKEVTRAMVYTPIRYRAISDTQNTESASPTGGRFVTVDNTNGLTTPTLAQFYDANPVPASALPLGLGTDTAPANGELLIGNGSGYVTSTLTAGTGVTITNGAGSITIDASGAQELLTATVKNAEATPITKGQVVYLYSATGNMPSVKLAANTSDATSAKTFGVVSSTSIAANDTGTVTCVGVVDGLNLGAYNDGDTVYLGATPGSITATKPYAPNHLVYVGIIERANAGNGELYVKVQNGYELDEIHDVQITSAPAAGALLMRDATNSLWKANRLSAGTNIAITNADTSVTVGLTGTVAVANGGTGASDAGTARTNLGLGTISTQNANNVAISGGSINSTTIGASSASTGAFTTLTASSTTDSTNKDTGSIITEGGLGVEKSANIGGNLTVSGTGTQAFSGAIQTTGGIGTTTAASAILDYSSAARVIARGASAGAYGVVKIAGTDSAGSAAITGGLVATFDSSNGLTTLAGNLTVSGTGTSSVAGKLTTAGNAPITWPANGTATASVVIGDQSLSSTAGVWINTPNNNPLYPCGLGVDGTYSEPNATINLKAYGVNAGGGYGSSLAFFTTNNTTLAEVGRFTKAGNLLVGTTTDNSATFAVNRGGVAPASSGSTSTAALRAVDVSNDLALDIGVNAASSPYPGWIQVHGRTNQATNYPLSLNPNGGNLLVGTTTDGGQKLQVAGTAIVKGSFFAARSDNTGSIQLIPTSGVSAGSDIESFNGSTSAYNRLNTRGTHFQVYTGTSGNTLALTVDDSQNATFVGTVKSSVTTGGKTLQATPSVTVAQDAIQNLVAQNYGFFLISETSITGSIAIIGFNAGGTYLVWQEGTNYSTTSNTASKFNVYYSSGNQLVVQNKKTGSASFNVINLAGAS